MNRELQERRADLLDDRMALAGAMSGLRDYFVATFAGELPLRWDWAERAWLQADASRPSHPSPDDLVEALAELDREVLRVAKEDLSGPSVWGHEADEFQRAKMRPYEQEGHGPRWTHVSDPIACAESRVFEILEQQFGVETQMTVDWASGAVSEPLAAILKMYGQAFDRLQRVDLAVEKLARQMVRSREQAALEERWA